MIDFKKMYEEYLEEVGKENDAYNGSLNKFIRDMKLDLKSVKEEKYEQYISNSFER